MDCTSTRIPYAETNAFSKIVLDYLSGAPSLRDFYTHPASLQGIRTAMQHRSEFKTDRKLLVEVLTRQYESLPVSEAVKNNIQALKDQTTFTVTTAHQNNLFTGPLYFVYKILHAIKLCSELAGKIPDAGFVPVFYIGSEDADLAELNHIYLGGEKISWDTTQRGAVGRMELDDKIDSLINIIGGQLGVLPFGKQAVELLRQHYVQGATLQHATFTMLNALFGEYGLIVLLPDNPLLKSTMKSVFTDDLLKQTASGLVDETANKLQVAGYKAQAHAREINLFYLEGNIRERIEISEDGNGIEKWKVVNTNISFTKEELLRKLESNPENFSPNVILRGVYQETILPNIAFIGGGGETAYWLQLKEVFNYYQTPFPALFLRNSFLLIEKKWREKIGQLGLLPEELFLPATDLVNKIVVRESVNQTTLNGSLTALEELYNDFKKQAAAVDVTLEKHVDSLKTHTLYKLQQLEKKMLRAEKRKFVDQQRQVSVLKQQLFPGNGLQERRDNVFYYYAKWGSAFIGALLSNSPGIEQEFTILQIK